jgi:hypothetical protein
VEVLFVSALLSEEESVASRPRFGGDSQAFSWVGTSWRGSAGQGPARPKGFSYVYKYQGVTQVDSRQ